MTHIPRKLATIKILLNLLLFFSVMTPLPSLATETPQKKMLVFTNNVAEYCPLLNCRDGKKGYVVDIAEAIYLSYGYDVIIRNLPWSRAIDMVSKGRADAVINILKKSAPGLIYPKEPISSISGAVFVHKSVNWSYSGGASLSKVKLGLIRGYGYGDGNPDLANYIEHYTDDPSRIMWVTGSSPLKRIMQMIMHGRINATIDEKNVGEYVIRMMGLEDEIFYAGNTTPIPEFSYMAFAPNNKDSEMLAKMFDEGISQLRRSGELDRILGKYGLKDWKNP